MVIKRQGEGRRKAYELKTQEPKRGKKGKPGKYQPRESINIERKTNGTRHVIPSSEKRPYRRRPHANKRQKWAWHDLNEKKEKRGRGGEDNTVKETHCPIDAPKCDS